MIRALALLLLIAAATPAQAQEHVGHHADHALTEPAPAEPDPHAHHHGPAAEAPPAPPAGWAADTVHDPAAMAAARAQLRFEHGGMRWKKVMLETAEWRPGPGEDGFGWEASASYGGDIHRLMIRTEGEGAGGRAHRAELQGLYARAIGPYFNLETGLARDLESGPRRTYAVLGLEGLAPYWFELGAKAFLSDRGQLSARLSGAYDLRLTQAWILEPRAELTLAASDDRARQVGSGLSSGEFGLRLRYAAKPELSPYVGLLHEARFGRTADLAQAAGEDARDTRLVLGLRAWF